MRSRVLGSIIAWAALCLVPAVSGQPAPYQPPKGPAPRLANGHPDFSGVWQSRRMADITKDMPCCKGAGELPYTALGKQQWESYDAAKGDYTGS